MTDLIRVIEPNGRTLLRWLSLLAPGLKVLAFENSLNLCLKSRKWVAQLQALDKPVQSSAQSMLTGISARTLTFCPSTGNLLSLCDLANVKIRGVHTIFPLFATQARRL